MNLLFSKKQKIGLLLLCFIILIIQISSFWYRNYKTNPTSNPIKSAELKPNPINIIKKDLNKATAKDLKEIKGIGNVLSNRIIKYKKYHLNGFFVSEQQLYEVYGLKKEVIDSIIKYFSIIHPPKIKKINPNFATALEMGNVPYIKSNIAKDIRFYIASRGPISKVEELENISSFPKGKMNFLKYYLTVNP